VHPDERDGARSADDLERDVLEAVDEAIEGGEHGGHLAPPVDFDGEAHGATNGSRRDIHQGCAPIVILEAVREIVR
jgi:hypothetical protein